MSKFSMAVLLNLLVIQVTIGMAYANLPTGFNAGLSTGVQSVKNQGTTQTITTNQARSIGSFHTFSIGKNHTVNVNQPNANSAFMAKVRKVGAPSYIHGKLNSNGAVGIINSAGVFVGKSGVVHTRGGFLASTQQLNDQAFLAGKSIQLTGHSSSAQLGTQNHGLIQVGHEGFVVLQGQQAVNTGHIEATHGAVALSATNQLKLVSADGIRFTFDNHAAKGLFGHQAGTVANTGLVKISGVSKSKHGSISLIAADGTVHNGGHLEAYGTQGYSVLLKGKDINQYAGTIKTDAGLRLNATNRIDVSRSYLLSDKENVELHAGSNIYIDEHSTLQSKTCDVDIWSRHGDITNKGKLRTDKGFIKVNAGQTIYNNGSAQSGEYGQIWLTAGKDIHSTNRLESKYGQIKLTAARNICIHGEIKSKKGNVTADAGHMLYTDAKINTWHGDVKLTSGEGNTFSHGNIHTEHGDIYIGSDNNVYQKKSVHSWHGDITYMAKKGNVYLDGQTVTYGTVQACATGDKGNVFVNGKIKTKTDGVRKTNGQGHVILTAGDRVAVNGMVQTNIGNITLNGVNGIHVGGSVTSQSGNVTLNATNGPIHRLTTAEISSQTGQVRTNNNIAIDVD